MAKFCYNCGNPIKDGNMFCSNCGAKLDSPTRVQPEQTRTQYNGDPNNQPQRQPQQSQRPQQEYIPNRQPVQPCPQYGNQQPPKKNHTVLIISLAIAGVVVIAALLLFFLPKFQHGGDTLPSSIPPVMENVTEAFSSFDTKEPTEEPTEAFSTFETEEPTEEPTEESTEESTEEPTEEPTMPAATLPYTDSLGKIEENDFAWISDAMSGSLDGSFLSNDELLGKWKGEFIFDGIWELVYVTIDTDGTVTVQPYMINYGDGWGDESGNPPYIFSGSFDINRVYGDGGYGKIDLYQFIVSGGTQYGIGQFNTTSGNKAEVYLVRP